MAVVMDARPGRAPVGPRVNRPSDAFGEVRTGRTLLTPEMLQQIQAQESRGLSLGELAERRQGWRQAREEALGRGVNVGPAQLRRAVVAGD